MSLFWLNDNLELPFHKAEVQRTWYSEASFKFQRLRLEQPHLDYTRAHPLWSSKANAWQDKSDRDNEVASQVHDCRIRVGEVALLGSVPASIEWDSYCSCSDSAIAALSWGQLGDKIVPLPQWYL
jgi:hypothetical protein